MTRRSWLGLSVGLAASLAACIQSVEVLTTVDAGAPDSGPPSGAFSLSGGDYHACAVRGGPLWCWGANENGEAAAGDAGLAMAPLQVGSDRSWVSVTCGEVHSCGLKQDGTVWCWGGNGAGQLGLGDTTSRASPTQVPLPGAAIELHSKFSHVCAILADASLWCWGSNYEGQLGLGDTFPGVDQLSPVAVPSDGGWKTVSGGQGHTCAIRLDGSLWCWGRNPEGEVGLPPAEVSIQPRAPLRVGSDTDWTHVDSSQEYTCGLKADGSLWCWGALVGSATNTERPARLSGGPWAAVRTNTFHLCALSPSGGAVCWGRNLEGQLGLDDLVERTSPTALLDPPFSELAVGRFFTCQRRGNGSIWCTGANEKGQLGVGDTSRRAVFTQLPFP